MCLWGGEKRGRGYMRRHTGLTGGWGLPEEGGQGGGGGGGGGGGQVVARGGFGLG
eukprot:COSAG01_NODE_67698_length_266_cov_0.622754_1_plen_54_part_01